MTIERARHILGTDIEGLSDKQVGELLRRASLLCSALLDLALNDIVKAKSASNSLRYEQNSHHLRSSERSVASR